MIRHPEYISPEITADFSIGEELRLSIPMTTVSPSAQDPKAHPNLTANSDVRPSPTIPLTHDVPILNMLFPELLPGPLRTSG
jgi:hypothetical protein